MCWMAVGCSERGATQGDSAKSVAAGGRVVRLDFPDSIRVDDPGVNDFIHAAMDACIAGDYGRFRALWSAKEDPLTREQFERGWHSAESIAVVELQPMRHPEDNSLLYYAHTLVELGAGVADPKRETVVLIIDEGGEWRLARAPKALSRKILGGKTREPNPSS
jgi:hypothetical protein